MTILLIIWLAKLKDWIAVLKLAWVSGFSGKGGGGGEGGREEGEKGRKAWHDPLRWVFHPLDEDDVSPQIVANKNNFRSCNCHVSDDRCERYELKLHTQLHCDRRSKQNNYFLLSTTKQNSWLDTASLQEEHTNLTVQNGKKRWQKRSRN